MRDHFVTRCVFFADFKWEVEVKSLVRTHGHNNNECNNECSSGAGNRQKVQPKLRNNNNNINLMEGEVGEFGVRRKMGQGSLSGGALPIFRHQNFQFPGAGVVDVLGWPVQQQHHVRVLFQGA